MNVRDVLGDTVDGLTGIYRIAHFFTLIPKRSKNLARISALVGVRPSWHRQVVLIHEENVLESA